MPNSAFSTSGHGGQGRGHSAEEPQGRPRNFDRHLYNERHLIENFFGKIKQFRAIATRYDKIARYFLAAIQLVAAAI